MPYLGYKTLLLSLYVSKNYNTNKNKKPSNNTGNPVFNSLTSVPQNIVQK